MLFFYFNLCLNVEQSNSHWKVEKTQNFKKSGTCKLMLQMGSVFFLMLKDGCEKII